MNEILGDETARVYRTLGQLYLEPLDREQLSKVQQWADSWLEAAGRTLPNEISESLTTIQTTDPSEIETLKTAFPRLFRGVSEQKSPDPPYESLYRDGAIYGESTTAVRNAYREAGLDVSDDEAREPADHLGIELQFLGELCTSEGRDDESVRDQKRRFIEEHIGVWIVDLRAAVVDADPPPFYQAVLELTEGLLQLEIDRIK